MGDNLACPDMVDGAKYLSDIGCDFVIHHIATTNAGASPPPGRRMPNPLDQLREVVAASKVPVQAVATDNRASRENPGVRRPWSSSVPLTIDADAFKTASGDVQSSLRMICEKVHAYGDVKPR